MSIKQHVKEHVENKLLLLRSWVDNNTFYFGQSMWEASAKRVLDDDTKSVKDVVESLEQGLLDYRNYIDEQEKDMDAADKRGNDALIALIEKVIAYAKTLL